MRCFGCLLTGWGGRHGGMNCFPWFLRSLCRGCGFGFCLGCICVKKQTAYSLCTHVFVESFLSWLILISDEFFRYATPYVIAKCNFLESSIYNSLRCTAYLTGIRYSLLYSSMLL